MTINILMPALSPTMTDGRLAKWLKKEGDKVSPGDVIAEIETDKATMEVEVIDSGTIGKIYIAEGTDGVKVNSIIAVLLENGESASDIPANNAISAQSISTNSAPTQQSCAIPIAEQSTKNDDRIYASPLAKRVALNNNVDLSQINGSGPHGRVIKHDVIEAMNNRPSEKAHQSGNTTTNNSTKDTAQLGSGTLLPLTNMRKVIAKRLLESKQQIPHFYLTVECNIDALLTLRDQLNNNSDDRYNSYKISVNDCIIKACANAIKTTPAVNASWTDDGIFMYKDVDISVAVSIPNGLITPIIRNADQKSLSTISNEIKDLAKRAKEEKLMPHEYQGGGFSVSNLGMYGIQQFSAIINPPQSCILAVGASVKKPIIENDNIAIGTTINITLSCDHRVVDGVLGAELLKKIKFFIEKPIALLA